MDQRLKNGSQVNVNDIFDSLWPMVALRCDQIEERLTQKYDEIMNNMATTVNDLKNKIKRLENSTNMKSILIHGIPNDVKVYDRTFLLKLIHYMGIADFSLSDIDNITRFNNKRSKSSKVATIKVVFISLVMRNKVMSSYMKFIKSGKNLSLGIINPEYPNQSIFFNDYLDKDEFVLFKHARALKKAGDVAALTVRYGIVMVRLQKGDNWKHLRKINEIKRGKSQNDKNTATQNVVPVNNNTPGAGSKEDLQSNDSFSASFLSCDMEDNGLNSDKTLTN